jgi:TPR repeat protein
MQDTLTDQELDQQLWVVLSCSNNPKDFVHFVRHAVNRDANHLVALNTAVHYRANLGVPSLLPASLTVLDCLVSEGSTTAMFHRGRWDKMGFNRELESCDAAYWFRMGMEMGDGRCAAELALLTAQTDKAAGVQLLHQAVGLGFQSAMTYLANFEPEQREEYLRLGAESGDPFSLYCLGHHLMKTAQPQDIEESMGWIRRAAVAGESDACLCLGLTYLNGDHGFEKDSTTAHEWLAMGGKFGSARCMAVLGRDLLHTEQTEDGKLWLMRACMLDEEFAQSTLGMHMLWRGQSPEEQAEGLGFLKAAAEQGHKGSIYRVGEAFQNGKGSAQNHEEAAHWYARGVALGSGECQSALGYLHWVGKGVAEDQARAHDLFQLASLQKDVWGTYLLGQSFSLGVGVAQDHQAALQCFWQAAEQNDPGATFKVGRAYLMGEGTDKNHGTAVRWLRKAASLGSRDAHLYLGLMLLYGDGVEENPAEAARWLRIAADHDSAQALYELGLLYANGKGMKQDMAEAQRLMAKAASLDDDDAKAWLDEHCPQKPDWLVKLRGEAGAADSE